MILEDERTAAHMGRRQEITPNYQTKPRKLKPGGAGILPTP